MSFVHHIVNTGYSDFQIPLGPNVVRRLSVCQENVEDEEISSLINDLIAIESLTPTINILTIRTAVSPGHQHQH